MRPHQGADAGLTYALTARLLGEFLLPILEARPRISALGRRRRMNHRAKSERGGNSEDSPHSCFPLCHNSIERVFFELQHRALAFAPFGAAYPFLFVLSSRFQSELTLNGHFCATVAYRS
jgi:hypothetical protein